MFSIDCTEYDHPELKGPFTRIALKLGEAQVCHWIVEQDSAMYRDHPELAHVFVAARLRNLIGAGPFGRVHI